MRKIQTTALLAALGSLVLAGGAHAAPAATLSKLRANRAVALIADQRATARSNTTYDVNADMGGPRSCHRVDAVTVACDYELDYFDRASVVAGDQWESDQTACAAINFDSPECDAILNEDPITDILVRTCYADDVTVTLADGKVTLAEPYSLACDDNPDQAA